MLRAAAAYAADVFSAAIEQSRCAPVAVSEPSVCVLTLLVGTGAQALEDANSDMGLGMDSQDIEYYTKVFTDLGRNPTSVECFDVGQSNSEHSRHW